MMCGGRHHRQSAAVCTHLRVCFRYVGTYSTSSEAVESEPSRSVDVRATPLRRAVTNKVALVLADDHQLTYIVAFPILQSGVRGAADLTFRTPPTVR